MNRVRRAVSIVSMVSGLALFVAGLGVRAGVVPLSGGTTAIAATSAAPLSSPAPLSSQAVSPSPSAPASISPPASLSPSRSPSADTGEPWFADDFDTVAAWPDGTLDWVTTSIVDGRYRIDAQETDLPVYVMAAAGDGSPGSSVSLTAEISIVARADPASAAGVALEDAHGMRLLALISADGRASLVRDSFESLDVLASGSVAAHAGPIELTLVLGGESATVSIDGRQVASARATLEAVGVGIGVWAVGGPATIDVDRYRVWVER